MQKVIIETGQLTRGAKMAGRSFFIAAAMCLIGGGISTYVSVSHFEVFLSEQSTTADQIRQQVGLTTHSLGASWLFIYVGLGLMVLGIGCYLFGRRTPAIPATGKT